MGENEGKKKNVASCEELNFMTFVHITAFHLCVTLLYASAPIQGQGKTLTS